MRVRAYNPQIDALPLRGMFEAQGLDYVYPDLDHPRFFTRLVLEDEEGKPVMALVGKLTAEMMFFMFPDEGTPKQRLERFLALHQASEHDMAEYGLDECFAEIPNTSRMGKFKRLLAFLGWVPMQEWSPWCKPRLDQNPQLPGSLQHLLSGGKEHKAIAQ